MIKKRVFILRLFFFFVNNVVQSDTLEQVRKGLSKQFLTSTQLGEFSSAPLGARVVKTFYSYICIVWSQYQIGQFWH